MCRPMWDNRCRDNKGTFALAKYLTLQIICTLILVKGFWPLKRNHEVKTICDKSLQFDANDKILIITDKVSPGQGD